MIFNVIKLATIVTLDKANWEEEVNRHIALKIKEKRMDLGFVA